MDLLDIEDFKSLFTVEYKSIFSELLKEENKDLLQKYKKDEIEFEQKKEKVPKDTPQQRFSKIDKNVRKSLSGSIGSKLILQLEKEILNLMKTKDEIELVIHFQDGFARYMAHSICKYYTLSSQSMDTQEGRYTRRITIIKKTKLTSMPDLLLSEFLKSQDDGFEGFSFSKMENFPSHKKKK